MVSGGHPGRNDPARTPWPGAGGEWAGHNVSEAMSSDLDAVSVSPPGPLDALQALGKMEAGGSNRLLVVSAGHLVGTLSLQDLLGPQRSGRGL